jgi:hypothetical protein
MGTISCQTIPSNMVVGLHYKRKQHKILQQLEAWQLEEFSVWEILFNTAANKKEIGGLDGFEGLLRCYVKLTPTRFIEQ